MKRAAAIVAALERVETEVTTNLVRMITPSAVTLIVREAARAALDEIVQRDAVATKRTVAEADAARAGAEQEIARLRTAVRLRDGELARQATHAAMEALRIPGEGNAPAAVERDVLGTLLDVKVAELAYDDGITLEQATREIRCRLFTEQAVTEPAPYQGLSRSDRSWADRGIQLAARLSSDSRLLPAQAGARARKSHARRDRPPEVHRNSRTGKRCHALDRARGDHRSERSCRRLRKPRSHGASRRRDTGGKALSDRRHCRRDCPARARRPVGSDVHW